MSGSDVQQTPAASSDIADLRNIVALVLGLIVLSTMLWCRSSDAQSKGGPTLPQILEAVQLGHISQAQQMMDQVLRDHPQSAKAHFVAAQLYARQGDFSSTRQQLDMARSLEPGLPFAQTDAVSALDRWLASGQAGTANRASHPGIADNEAQQQECANVLRQRIATVAQRYMESYTAPCKVEGAASCKAYATRQVLADADSNTCGAALVRADAGTIASSARPDSVSLTPFSQSGSGSTTSNNKSVPNDCVSQIYANCAVPCRYIPGEEVNRSRERCDDCTGPEAKRLQCYKPGVPSGAAK